MLGYDSFINISFEKKILFGNKIIPDFHKLLISGNKRNNRIMTIQNKLNHTNVNNMFCSDSFRGIKC